MFLTLKENSLRSLGDMMEDMGCQLQVPRSLPSQLNFQLGAVGFPVGYGYDQCPSSSSLFLLRGDFLRNDLEWPFTGRRQLILVCGVQSCPILCFSVESLKCVTVSLLLFRQWQFPAEFSRHISFDLSLRGRFSSCCQFVVWPFFYLQVFGVSIFLCELSVPWSVFSSGAKSHL